jgi:hypothetical protein
MVGSFLVPQQVGIEPPDPRYWVGARRTHRLPAHGHEHTQRDASGKEQQDGIVQQLAHDWTARRRARGTPPMRRIHQ